MKKELLIIFGVIAAGASALIFVGNNIAKKSELIESLKIKKSDYYRASEDLAALRSDLEKVEPYLAGIESLNVSEDQLVSFPRELKSLASQFKIDLTVNFLKSDKAKEDGTNWLAFNGSIEGSAGDIILFLKAFQNWSYPVKIESLNFTRKNDGFGGSFTGKAFYFSDK